MNVYDEMNNLCKAIKESHEYKMLVEAKGKLYVFAMNMDLTDAAALPLRESITLECLRTLKLL